MKKLKIVQELPKYETETQSEQMLLEKWHLSNVQCRAATNKLVKKKKAKRNLNICEAQ